MRSLFAAILAISTNGIINNWASPAIASPIEYTNQSSSSQSLRTLQYSDKYAGSNQFGSRTLRIAKQVPIDAMGLLMLDLDANSWQIASSTIDPVGAIDQLFVLAGKFPEISIAKDIKPWLGQEMAIAFLVNNNDKKEFGFAALLPISDETKFILFQKKIKRLNLPKPTETLYQNVIIWEWQLPEKNLDGTEPVIADQPQVPDFSLKRWAIAQLPNGVAVIASDRQSIQQIIDTTETKSLADNQLFLRSLNHPQWDKSVIAGYGDFQGLGQISELLAADLPETSEISGFSRAEYLQGLRYTLSQYSSMDLFTWITPTGIRSQSSSYFSSRRSPLPADNATRDRLLSYLPANIYGAITSRNFNRQWQWFVEESKVQPSYKVIIEGVRAIIPLIIGSGLQLDFEKDIAAWIDGEYAFVAFPSDLSPFQDVGVDLTMGMLIRTSQPEAANATLAKITKYLASFKQSVVQVKKRQIGATSLTSFELPSGSKGETQSAFAYGWRDRQTLLLTLGANTAAAFTPIPTPALADLEMFREAIFDMPQPNFGYFYLNAKAIAKQTSNFLLLAGVIPNIGNTEKPKLPEAIAQAINQLGGAVFVYSENSDRLQADFFLGLKSGLAK
jgi:hypothetical protein